jgi:tetratricopeptide (TPR) repeat protein
MLNAGPGSTPVQPRNKKRAILAAAVGVCAAAVHWPVLSTRALWLDDDQYLTKNPLVQQPGWHNAARFFAEVFAPSTVRGYYQPLTMVSLMLDRAVAAGPEDLAPFRRTSLVLHAANTALVVVFLGLLFDAPWAAALAGLLFGLHPVTTEVTPWVAERKTLLATFFALVALILYLHFVRTERRGVYIGVLVAFGLALLAKPTATPLPILMLILDAWPLRRLSSRALREKIPLFVLAAVFAVITLISQTKTASALLPTEYTLPRIPLLLFHNLGFYARNLIWPIGLAPYYPFPEPFALSNPAVLTTTAAGVGLCIGLWLLRRRAPGLWAGALFAIFALLPTLGLIGFTTAIACNKYLYLPIVGLLLTLTAWLAGSTAVAEKRPAWRRVAAPLAVLAAAGSLIPVTRDYLTRWRDSETLLGYALARTPHSYLVHNNYGTWLAEHGRLHEALEHFRTAVRLRHDYWIARINLGIALRDLGRLDEAVAVFRQMVAEVPNHANPHFNLATVLARQQRIAEACEEYAIAVRLDPRYSAAWTNWGVVLLENGQTAEAIQRLETALSLNPADAVAHFNLGLGLERTGRLEEAAEHYRAAARLDPRGLPAFTNLGLVRIAQGRLQEAVDAFRAALEANPRDALAHLNLGALAAGAGQLEAAESHLRTAIALDPNSAEAHNNLGALLVRQQRYEESLAPLATAVAQNPDHANAHYLRGAALNALHRYEEALAHLKRAVELQPGDREACEELASAYAGTGSFHDAIAAATRALELARAAGDSAAVARWEERIAHWRAAQAAASAPAGAATLPAPP